MARVYGVLHYGALQEQGHLAIYGNWISRIGPSGTLSAHFVPPNKLTDT